LMPGRRRLAPGADLRGGTGLISQNGLRANDPVKGGSRANCPDSA
jgi:hypothetical protein